MAPSLRDILSLILFTLLFSQNIVSQPKVGESISLSVGFGITAPFDDIDLGGSGFYVESEYVIGLKKWLGVRPYVGFISTSPDKNNTAENLSEFEVTSKAFFFGGKARILAPIPWFAPYIEIGIGTSIGSFVTYTPYENIEKNGIVLHIPFTIGVALGPKNNFEIAFNYYFLNSVAQFNGAAAIGFSFPLKD